ncbi:MAG: hypothetical protein ACR2PS_06005 [Pseudomonadales bacterium]
MANVIYPKFKEACIGGGANTDLSTVDVRFALVDGADYTYSAAHEFLTSVPAGGRVALTTAGVGSKSVTDGVFDAADITWSSVTGDESEIIIGYVHTGSDATARLIFYLDTGVTGLPVTPNGGDINCAWDGGANKIFAL